MLAKDTVCYRMSDVQIRHPLFNDSALGLEGGDQ